MKKFLLAAMPLVLTLAAASTCSAQSAGPSGGTPPAGFSGKAGAHGGGAARLQMANDILAKMDLKPDQRTKITVLEEKLKTDVKALRKEAKANPADKAAVQAKGKALRKSFDEDLLGVLTPDQQTEFKALMKAEMVKRRKAALAAKAEKKTPPPSN